MAAIVFLILVLFAAAINWLIFVNFLNRKSPDVRHLAKRFALKLLKVTAVVAGVFFVVAEAGLLLSFQGATPEARADVPNPFVGTIVLALGSGFTGLFIVGAVGAFAALPNWGKSSKLQPCESCGGKNGASLFLCGQCQNVVCSNCSPGGCKLCRGKGLVGLL